MTCVVCCCVKRKVKRQQRASLATVTTVSTIAGQPPLGPVNDDRPPSYAEVTKAIEENQQKF